ncbi:methyltransferase domain-containing protein [Geoalkalibacter halelectricus]|uniref:methyltransferase domain-containing protein n=1 Tax=Geoalkalibacter halelectricus TaxID=2847045 RepID=UPI003D1A0C30
MPDLYADISNVPPEIQERLAGVLEARAADARQKEMLNAYLSEIAFPMGARVLEIGCGTGAVTRTLAGWPGVSEAVGIDLSAIFIAKARELSKGVRNISFEIADGRSVSLADASFDVVVVHTTLSHVPEPKELLDQAYRLLRSGGWLAVFDGDYATATVSTGDADPLNACIDAFRSGFVHDPWLIRRLPALMAAAGFSVQPARSHGYVEEPQAGYLLTWIDRGADVLVQNGRIGGDMAEALKAEARRRSAGNEWFGHIAFASILARKAV